jgi:integrase
MKFKEIKENVLNDEYYKKWAHGISKGTQRQYMYSLAGFCMATSKTPTELLAICKKDYSKPPWERNIDDWFINYDQFCENEKLSKETFKKRKSDVRGFFRFYHIDSPTARRGKKENFKRANDRKLPTKKDLILLLNACNTIKNKAIILTQFSSGLSNSDIVKLTIGQYRRGIDENDICKLKFRRNKNENEVVTFISPEGVQAIKSYLRVERDNLEDSQPLFTQYKSSNTAMQPVSIIRIYERLCDSLGWSKDGNAFRKITGHMGRKWLKTNLTNAGMPREPLETMLGHMLKNGTDDNYYMMNENHLLSIYMKYLPNITIDPTETLTLESEEYKTLKDENKTLKQQMEERDEQHRVEIEAMKAKVDNSVEEMNANVSKLEKRWIKKLEENPQYNKELSISDYHQMAQKIKLTDPEGVTNAIFAAVGVDMESMKQLLDSGVKPDEIKRLIDKGVDLKEIKFMFKKRK